MSPAALENVNIKIVRGINKFGTRQWRCRHKLVAIWFSNYSRLLLDAYTIHFAYTILDMGKCNEHHIWSTDKKAGGIISNETALQQFESNHNMLYLVVCIVSYTSQYIVTMNVSNVFLKEIVGCEMGHFDQTNITIVHRNSV